MTTMLDQDVPSRPERIRDVFVLTKDRPQELLRCLSSFAAHFRLFGRVPRMVLCDDSTATAHANANRAILASVGRRYGLSTAYIGKEAKAHLRQTVAKAIDSADLSQTLFSTSVRLRNSPGANRNFAAALGGDRPYLMLDDDAICMQAKSACANGSFRYAMNASSELQTEFLTTSWQAKVRRYERLSECLLSAHEALLNHKAGLAVKAPRAPKVAVVMTGIAGDSAMPSPIGLLWKNLETRRCFDAICRSLDDLLLTRQVVRTVDANVVARCGPLMTTTTTSFEGNLLLPPFLRNGTGEDSAFGTMLFLLVPQARFGYLPTAILHHPRIRRAYDLNEMPLHTNDVIVTIMMMLNREVQAYPCESDRYAFIGARLRGLAARSSRAFASMVTSVLRAQLYSRKDFLEQLLDQDVPYREGTSTVLLHRWHREVTRALDDNRLSKHCVSITTDSSAVIQRDLQDTGELLAHWPRVNATVKGLCRPFLTEPCESLAGLH